MIWSIQEVFLTVEQALGLSHRLDDTYTKEGYYRRFAPTLPTSSMTFHEELLQSCPPPSGSMFGKEEDESDAGLNQAKVLSGLMRTTRPFCLLCLGDMELVYLLAGRKFGDGPMSGKRGEWTAENTDNRSFSTHPSRDEKLFDPIRPDLLDGRSCRVTPPRCSPFVPRYSITAMTFHR